MAKIGSLTADLKLESAAFIRDLKKAADATARNTSAMQKSMAGLQTSFATAGKAISGAVAGFVSVAAVRSLAQLGKAAIDTADEIATAATRIGIGAEQLQKFRFAAEQADVETAQLDLALQLFAKNLATGKIAAEGNNIAEAFRNYIGTIAAAPTQLEKVRIAQAAFGKQWQAAMLLAAQGAEEFQRQVDGAFVISNHALAVAGRLDNQFREISNAVSTGFATGILEAFGSSLKANSDELTKLHEIAKLTGTALAEGFKFATDAAALAASAIKTINEELKPISDFLNFMVGIKEQMPELSFEGMNDDLNATTQAVTQLGEAMKNAAPQAKALAKVNEEAAKTAQFTAKSYVDGAAQITQTLSGAFTENKGFAIANAVMNVAQGISQALTLPFPLNWGQVAAVTAAGIAQINTIRAARPGSAGKPSAGNGSSAAVASGGGGGGGSRSAGPQSSVNISLQGSSRFTTEEVRDMLNQLVDAQRDGAQLVVR